MTESTTLSAESATVAAQLIRLVTDYAVQHGSDVAALLASVGWAQESLNEAEVRLPFPAFRQLCERLAADLGDPCLGLHIGQMVKPGYLGSLGFVLMSCSTVEEALQRSRRYSGIILDACSNEFELHDEVCIRYWRSRLPGGAPVGRLQDDMNMAVWVTLARWITGHEEFVPAWVAFQHARPAPAEVAEYRAVFRCPVRFSAPETAIAIPREVLAWPLPQANPSVRRMLDVLCERLLEQTARQSDPDWLIAVRETILKAFDQSGPDLSVVAEAVGLNADELSRRLARQGLSFRGLVDELRRKLALAYVDDPSLSLADITYLLGFSEQSAMQRAFKRWTGQTPGEYRRRTV